MSAFIAKQISKRIFGEKLENKWGAKDPVFEQIPATRLDGTPNGKFKKVRRALPPGISEHDAQVLTKVKKRAYKLDMSLFSCCGVRFGWGSVIGIFPVAGDLADATMAMMVVNTAKQVEGGLPSSILLQMYLWVLVDLIVGFVPFAGDVGDALLKANSRNSVLLEEHLREKGKKNLRKSGQPIPAVDPSDPDEFDRFQSSSQTEYVSEQPGRHGGMSANQAPKSQIPQSSGVTQTREDRRSGGGSFFGFGGNKKSRPVDPEMGHTGETPATRSTGRG
ncbi:PH domain-containing protein [Xylariales sp. AK1849]|nr:PH domain-containing protein [Xylariales sp. AK1849]